MSGAGGLLAVRRGVTRTVVLAGRWAIKVPSARSYGGGLRGVLWSLTRGIQANLSEAEWWSSSPGVCPVRWSFAGLINIYPRCAPPPGNLAPEDYRAIGFIGPTDPKPSNVGLLGGRLVWLDYDMSWNDCLACRRIGVSAGQPS